jgi:pyridoxamine 5'-phosphate oxidase
VPDFPLSPLKIVAAWWGEARAANEADPDAMVLATVSREGMPSSRVVLCRGLDQSGARFFTNYESRKGKELAQNPRASALFYWPLLRRQVRLEGVVEKLSAAESDAYFSQRPRGHQIGAWASAQSHPLASLDALTSRYAELDKTWHKQVVPRPPFWGGYRLVPDAIELWQEGENRLHTRRAFRRERANEWVETLLAP